MSRGPPNHPRNPLHDGVYFKLWTAWRVEVRNARMTKAVGLKKNQNEHTSAASGNCDGLLCSEDGRCRRDIRARTNAAELLVAGFREKWLISREPFERLTAASVTVSVESSVEPSAMLVG
jgi:hypothetical protein